MSDTLGAVVAGVAIFVIGQLIIKFAIEPVEQFRALRGEIAHALVFYANAVFFRPVVDRTDFIHVQDTLRGLGSDLWKRAYAIPAPIYWILVCCRIVPSKSQLQKASSAFIGWSNSLIDGNQNIEAHRQTIRQALKLNTQ